MRKGRDVSMSSKSAETKVLPSDMKEKIEANREELEALANGDYSAGYIGRALLDIADSRD